MKIEMDMKVWSRWWQWWWWPCTV